MSFYKGVANQAVRFKARTLATGAPAPGLTNIDIWYSADGSATLTKVTSPTVTECTGASGYPTGEYVWSNMAGTVADYQCLRVCPVSATATVDIEPVTIYTSELPAVKAAQTNGTTVLSSAYDPAKTAAQPGADGDTLETLSDQIDLIVSYTPVNRRSSVDVE